jgi:polyisoprenoid-binding protein YceI
MMRGLTAFLMLAGAGVCAATPETYTADPNHTFTSFEVSHGGNFTITRGFFQKNSGKVALDRAARTGSIEIIVDVASMTTGHQHRDTIVRTEWFKVDQFPSMIYRSNNLRFSDDSLAGADGELTLAGVTRPVSLTVTSFKCRPHPVNKKEQCGADGTAQIKRSDFGLTAASSAGDDIKIQFQIEAYKD